MRVLEVFGEPIASGGQEAFVFNVVKHMDRSGLELDFFTPYACSSEYNRRKNHLRRAPLSARAEPPEHHRAPAGLPDERAL